MAERTGAWATLTVPGRAARLAAAIVALLCPASLFPNGLCPASLRPTSLFPAASAAAATPPTGQVRVTGHCAASVLGYLWSDGHERGSVWAYRTNAPRIATQFGTCVTAIGARSARSWHRGRTDFTVHRMTLVVNAKGTPPRLVHGSPSDVKAFLAAVIEGEGSRSGLVLDDPDHARVISMVQLLAVVGVRTKVTGVRYWRVYAERADWPVIHTFPFVVWGRVPGGR